MRADPYTVDETWVLELKDEENMFTQVTSEVVAGPPPVNLRRNARNRRTCAPELDAGVPHGQQSHP